MTPEKLDRLFYTARKEERLCWHQIPDQLKLHKDPFIAGILKLSSLLTIPPKKLNPFIDDGRSCLCLALAIDIVNDININDVKYLIACDIDYNYNIDAFVVYF